MHHDVDCRQGFTLALATRALPCYRTSSNSAKGAFSVWILQHPYPQPILTKLRRVLPTTNIWSAVVLSPPSNDSRYYGKANNGFYWFRAIHLSSVRKLDRVGEPTYPRCSGTGYSSHLVASSISVTIHAEIGRHHSHEAYCSRVSA